VIEDTRTSPAHEPSTPGVEGAVRERVAEAAPVVSPAAGEAERRQGPAPRVSGRGRRLLGRVVRGVVFLAVVAGLLGAIYVGWPVFYNRYVVPIQTNTADVGALRAEVSELQGRVATLEQTAAEDGTRLDAIEGQLSDHAATLATLQAMDRQLGEADAAAAAELQREIRILRAMELMSRARLFLYESNFGLATEDLQAARDLLAGLGTGTPVSDAATVADVLDRLDRSLGALPEFPVVASADLDIAWQLVLGSVPIPTAAPGPTSEPVASPDASPSAEPAASGEPSPSTVP
jgi:hypothetical protein